MPELRFSLPNELHEAYSAAARSAGLSLAAWTKMALAAYYAKWKAPIKMHKEKTGHDPSAEGRWCMRCDTAASACRHPELHKSWDEWEEVNEFQAVEQQQSLQFRSISLDEIDSWQ